ncbi:GTP cyclohydrolase 1 type 2/Nif3 [Mycena latifolia]|nr:GTP cyclohydrolase 1 type 2/Nif3 [Mycena latifolia]
MSLQRFKLVFFCPAANTRAIVDHLFQKFPATVGKIGNYEHCAFLTRGTGQFRPAAGAQPVIGAVGTLEFVEEDRVEVVVRDQVRDVVRELKAVHPYEEVAYDVYKLEDF